MTQKMWVSSIQTNCVIFRRIISARFTKILVSLFIIVIKVRLWSIHVRSDNDLLLPTRLALTLISDLNVQGTKIVIHTLYTF